MSNEGFEYDSIDDLVNDLSIAYRRQIHTLTENEKSDYEIMAVYSTQNDPSTVDITSSIQVYTNNIYNDKDYIDSNLTRYKDDLFSYVGSKYLSISQIFPNTTGNLSGYPHLYVSYYYGERVFTIHYTLDYKINGNENGYYNLYIKNIEMLKYDIYKGFYTVNNVVMNDLFHYQCYPDDNRYLLDVNIGIPQYKVLLSDRWYNYSDDTTIGISNIYTIIVARETDN